MKTLILLLAILILPQARAEEDVDLQWSICDAQVETTVESLGGHKHKFKTEQITYYDSRPPRYLRLGITMRTKLKDSLESSVKRRSNEGAYSSDSSCEWDRYGDMETQTCEVAESDRQANAPWSKAQEGFVPEVDWSSLTAFGPYQDRKWKIKIDGMKTSLDAVEGSDFPPLIELSIKVPRAQGDGIYRSVTKELVAQGVHLCATQESKTARLFHHLGF